MFPVAAALQRTPGVLSHFHLILTIPFGLMLTSVKGNACSLSYEQRSRTSISSPQQFLSWFSLLIQRYLYFCIDSCTTGKAPVLGWSEEVVLGDARCPGQQSSRHRHLPQLLLQASQHRFHPAAINPWPSRDSAGGHAVEMRAVVTPSPMVSRKGGFALANSVEIMLFILISQDTDYH